MSFTALEGTNPANTLISDLQPPELGDKFMLFKPRSLWYFVTVAWQTHTVGIFIEKEKEKDTLLFVCLC